MICLKFLRVQTIHCLEVAKHEITHLQVQSPKLYEEYKTYVIDSMKQNDSKEYENAFNNIKDLHRINGIKISDSAIEDEIVADATDRFLTDENSIKELAKSNPKLGQKILDIIREFIKTVQDSVQGISKLLNVEQLNKAEQLWVNALNDAIENKKVVEVQKEAAIAKNSLKEKTNKKILVERFDTRRE